jgi:hypothetical protein
VNRRRDTSLDVQKQLSGWTTGVQFPARAMMRIFLFATAFRPVLGPTQTPIQWVPSVKRPGREGDYSPPSGAEVKNAWSYTSTSLTCLHRVVFNEV